MDFKKIFFRNPKAPESRQAAIPNSVPNNKFGNISKDEKNTLFLRTNDFSWEESLPRQDVSEDIGAQEVGPKMGEGKSQTLAVLTKRSLFSFFSKKPKVKKVQDQEKIIEPLAKKQVAPTVLPKSTAPQIQVRKPIKIPLVPKSVAFVISGIIVLVVGIIITGSLLYEPLRPKKNILPISIPFINNLSPSQNPSPVLTPTPTPKPLIDRRSVSWFVPIAPSVNEVQQTEFWKTLETEFFEAKYPKEWHFEDITVIQAVQTSVFVLGPLGFDDKPITIQLIDLAGQDGQTFAQNNFSDSIIQKITLDDRPAFHLSFEDGMKEIVILPIGISAVRIDLQRIALEDSQIFNFIVASIKVKI